MAARDYCNTSIDSDNDNFTNEQDDLIGCPKLASLADMLLDSQPELKTRKKKKNFKTVVEDSLKEEKLTGEMFRALMTEIRDMKEIALSTQREVSRNNKIIHKLVNDIEDTKKKNKELEQEITLLKREVIQLKDNIRENKSVMNDIERREIKGKVVLSGPVIERLDVGSNDLKRAVSVVVDQKLSYKMQSGEIKLCRPLGKRNDKLLVEFADVESKKQLISAVIQSYPKPKDLYVNEFLTKSDSQIFYEMRKLRKDLRDKIHSVFTRNQRIFYKLHKTSEKVEITSLTGVVDLRNSLR